jgi:hypothetical protein
MDNGKTTKLKASEFILIWMAPATRASGKKISSMAKALKLGMMELRTKVFT